MRSEWRAGSRPGSAIAALVVGLACVAGTARLAARAGPDSHRARGRRFATRRLARRTPSRCSIPSPAGCSSACPVPASSAWSRRGAGLDVVGGRRVDLRGVRLQVRRGPLRVGVRDYIGPIEVWRQGEGLLLVNELAMEEYVAGTVRGEVSERWPVDALRALAVVARSYVVFQQGRTAGKLFHVVAGNQDQNFAGWVAEGSPAREAARATAGQVLTWRGSGVSDLLPLGLRWLHRSGAERLHGRGRPAARRCSRRVLDGVTELHLDHDPPAHRDRRATAPRRVRGRAR